ncbi:hypothetical protein D3C73_1342300 [compost metagenome]
MLVCSGQSPKCHFVAGRKDGGHIPGRLQKRFKSLISALVSEIAVYDAALVNRNMMLAKRTQIPFQPGHARQLVLLSPADHSDIPVSFADQIFYSLEGRRIIVDSYKRNIRIGAFG